jgi:hypothetical protein
VIERQTGQGRRSSGAVCASPVQYRRLSSDVRGSTMTPSLSDDHTKTVMNQLRVDGVTKASSQRRRYQAEMR